MTLLNAWLIRPVGCFARPVRLVSRPGRREAPAADRFLGRAQCFLGPAGRDDPREGWFLRPAQRFIEPMGTNLPPVDRLIPGEAGEGPGGEGTSSALAPPVQ